MAALVTLPTDYMYQTSYGDIDVFAGADPSNTGTGSIYIRSGDLYVEGLTDLDQVTITTDDGKFEVLGSNKVQFGVTNSIELTAQTTSFFTTTAGTLTLSATATDSTGKVSIVGAGTGTDSILLNASNATDGQITLTSAGASTSIDAIRLLATDTTDGNILLEASGNYAATNPAIKLSAPNSTSGQISLVSAGDSGSIDAITLNATGSTGGNVSIVAAGTTSPAILLDATGTGSSKILLRSASDATTENAIELVATDTTEGNILIDGKGTNTNTPAVKILADNATSGQVFIEADGNIADAIRLTSAGGSTSGIDIDANGLISIDTTNTSSGITIGTATAGVPITIGTATSVTTVSGNLIVGGTYEYHNVETFTVEDNIIVLNSGNGELDLDSGIMVRRFQTPNAAGTGNVVNGNNPIQESGAFQAGSATPGTLVLDAHSSSTTDFYVGWWIRITSGTASGEVHRIKTYNGTTKTVTLYLTADNTSTFTDGLDLVAAPSAADTYSLYSDGYSTSFYEESSKTWTLANATTIPNPISSAGPSIVSIQQHQELHTGEIDIFSQIYNNVKATASTTTITLTIKGHSLTAGNAVSISNSNGLTPSITSGLYTVQTTPTSDTFTITVGSSTTAATGASVTVDMSTTSRIKVNVIEPHDPAYSISIPGITSYEDITIPKTSTAYFFLNTISTTYGSVKLMVFDLNNTDGAGSIFEGTMSTASTGGSLSRQSTTIGADGQRINGTWALGEKIKIRHQPAGSGGGSYTYRCRIFSCL